VRKVVLILCCVVLASSCSTTKKFRRDTTSASSGKGQKLIIQNVLKNNLTTGSFFIEKAEYVIKTRNIEFEGVASIKFKSPDKYLISIKSFGGLEVMRVFLTKDSVFINNRLKKQYMFGSENYLNSALGVSLKVIPVLFGDCICTRNISRKEEKCENGFTALDEHLGGIDIRYNIDCNKEKVKNAIVLSSKAGHKISAEYNDFKVQKEIIYPGEIQISDSETEESISLSIKKISFDWDGAIEFIPGKQFDKVPLI
jgi:hypothetical protein